MRLLTLTILILLSIVSFGQKTFNKIILVNNSSSFKGAFLFFPLLNDTIKIDGLINLFLDTTNQKRKLFYCCFKDEKSKIYNLDTDQLTNTIIDFKIPNTLFFDNLYKSKTCPWCHRKDSVVPFIYGKPSKELIKLADKGEVKLAGCSLSNTSPKFYCKRDSLEF